MIVSTHKDKIPSSLTPSAIGYKYVYKSPTDTNFKLSQLFRIRSECEKVARLDIYSRTSAVRVEDLNKVLIDLNKKEKKYNNFFNILGLKDGKSRKEHNRIANQNIKNIKKTMKDDKKKFNSMLKSIRNVNHSTDVELLYFNSLGHTSFNPVSREIIKLDFFDAEDQLINYAGRSNFWVHYR
jgi:hypothetical protein